jgi:thiol-disulfide isomerase/thioredoxin
LKFRKLSFLSLAIALLAFGQQQVTIVDYVRGMMAGGSPAAAQQGLDKYHAAKGITPEYILALSWIGRGELGRKNYDAAEKNAAEVRKLALAELKRRKLDAEPQLPLALGASIEVEAQSLAAQNRRDEAVTFLNTELAQWQGTSIHDRVQKNLNLLTLEGKPVPELEVSQYIGGRKALPLSAHRGHPVLIFMWAHWCSDCKNEIGIVQKLQAKYTPRGLVVVAPTQHYGYIAGGQDAPRDVETKYIGQVFTKYYSGLGTVEIPLSERNFARFGVSTTPTMVLVDGKGIVRLYNPGNASYELLSAKIETALKG